jgi:hypothetical protein
MATKYIRSLDDFFISKQFDNILNFSVFDTPQTIYDLDVSETMVEEDINNSLDIIHQKVIHGCITPKPTSEIEVTGLAPKYQNYIGVYNPDTNLKTIISVEYDIKDFAININTGGNIIPGKLSLNIIKATFGKVGLYPYINAKGMVSKNIVHKPLLIQIGGNKRPPDIADFRIC